MAGGPFRPFSQFPVTGGSLFSGFHVSAAANFKRLEGLQVAASIATDAIWEIAWDFPISTLPTGTCKLQLLAQANATSGAAKVNPKWASVAVGEDPGALTLNAEGTSTLTWAAGNADDLLELKITLDADTPVAGELLVMKLTFETASWTLAQVSTWQPRLIFE